MGRKRTKTIVNVTDNMSREMVLELLSQGICPLCGKGYYLSTGHHMFYMHGISAHEFKELYDMNEGQPLCTPEESDKRRDKTLTTLENNPGLLDELKARMPRVRPQHQERRGQYRDDMSKKMDKGLRKELVCATCGESFKSRAYYGEYPKYCSEECYAPDRLKNVAKATKAYTDKLAQDPEFKQRMKEISAQNASNTRTPEGIAKLKESGLNYWDSILGPAEHGTSRMYSRGCRCDLCRAENTKKSNEWYAKNRKGRHKVPHSR